ncbi:tyrosine-type recombinase/integrase [Thiomicrospira microaerophila]|uniref:tyrosine-type recombinase/integrase n=1 Tax=Thiomicrospira microaerophila TaxID=406020 RepID=UPI00200DB933|nr:integrase arm-type DNA-binding domain-containing protein [Thiomicrospira microaerophila]UQB43139.1 tyrosine-type recombinase/integrase [Thiomicrospira microaerophila]
MKRQLTDAKVKTAKPKDTAYKLTDGGGLFLYVTKAGAKSFRYDCALNGKRATLTLGLYPETSLADARAKHESARALIAQGIDPRINEVSKLEPFSFYALEQIKVSKIEPRTALKKTQRLEKYLFNHLDRIPADKITTIDLLNLIKPVSDKHPETALRLASDCRQTFNYLIALQKISTNPAAMLSDLLPAKPEPVNMAHTTDAKQLAILLKAFDAYHGDFAVKQALRLMPLVILRPANIRFLKWEFIDFENKLITFPADTMKKKRIHKVPLSQQALEILEAMRPVTGSKEHVFIAGNRTKPLSENTLNKAIQYAKHPQTAEPIGKGLQTSHGFRHTISTALNEMRFDGDAIELQLAHLNRDRIARVYNKSELLAERAKMMQAWADYLDSLKMGAQVIPIKRQA